MLIELVYFWEVYDIQMLFYNYYLFFLFYLFIFILFI